jgi:S-adenosylmethionine hydrolase
LSWPEVHAIGGPVAGTVLHVDRFGNLITSIAAETVERLGRDVMIHIAGRELPLVGTYGDLTLGAAGALVGSGGRLEVAIREGSAAVALKARRGTPVTVSSKGSTTGTKTRTTTSTSSTKKRRS